MFAQPRERRYVLVISTKFLHSFWVWFLIQSAFSTSVCCVCRWLSLFLVFGYKQVLTDAVIQWKRVVSETIPIHTLMTYKFSVEQEKRKKRKIWLPLILQHVREMAQVFPFFIGTLVMDLWLIVLMLTSVLTKASVLLQALLVVPDWTWRKYITELSDTISVQYAGPLFTFGSEFPM